MKPVLLVIDMQKIFAPGYEWYTPGIEQAENNIIKLCEKFENRVFTRHVASENPIGTWKNYNEVFSHINKNEECLEIIEGLQSIEKVVFTKTTYSAFNSGSALEYIQTHGYTDVLITGVQTEFCVLGTILTAVDAGVSVTFIPDACAGSSSILNKAVEDIVKLMPCQAQIKYTEELLNGLS